LEFKKYKYLKTEFMGQHKPPTRSREVAYQNKVASIRWKWLIKKETGVSKNRGTPKWILLYWKTLSKWMIWGYHHFRKPPNRDRNRSCTKKGMTKRVSIFTTEDSAAWSPALIFVRKSAASPMRRRVELS